MPDVGLLTEVALCIFIPFVCNLSVKEPQTVESHRLPPGRRIEPSPVGCHLRAHLLWPPCAGLVLVNRSDVSENWIHDSPRLFDVVLTRKPRRISPHSVEQEFLVSPHLGRIGFLADHEFDVLPFNLLASFPHQGADRYH